MSPFFDASDHADATPTPGDTAHGEIRPFHTVNLVELAKAGVPAPELLCHDLLYPSGLHSLAGTPDSGKSTVLYLFMAELLAAGNTVALIDEESGQEATVEKFLALGIEPAHLERLAYVEFPARKWDQADRAGLWELLGRVQPVLAGYDSAAALLAAAGKDEDRATDVTPFYRLLLEASRTFRAAGVVLDHLPKGERGGRYARGSGAKLATVDVAFLVDPVKPFSRHQSGLLKLSVTKDRRGYLHRDWEIRVEVEDGAMTLAFSQVETAASDELAGLSPAARKILEALREAAEPITVKAIIDRIAERHGHGLRRETVSRELNAMYRDGLVDAIEEGQAKLWIARPPEGCDRDVT